MAQVLVVGGAGYIGSVTARALLGAGHGVVNLDDLSSGHAAAVHGELIVGDVRDRALLARIFAARPFDAVLHFAAKSLVGESVTRPIRYFDNNVAGTLCLLAAMEEAGVGALVFSSTCAIYGDPLRLPLDEDHPHQPISPYGESKAIIEAVLATCRAQGAIRATTLRYFNAAGATEDGLNGEAHDPETHLIPLCLAAAYGQRPPITVMGTDYPTPDGTCIRDYVHVLDLADAHLRAMDRLLAGAPGGAYNLGTGRGHSVREVLASVQRVVGQPVPCIEGPRRAGDPPALYAIAAKANAELGWAPRYTQLDDIIRTTAGWARAPRYGRG